MNIRRLVAIFSILIGIVLILARITLLSDYSAVANYLAASAIGLSVIAMSRQRAIAFIALIALANFLCGFGLASVAPEEDTQLWKTILFFAGFAFASWGIAAVAQSQPESKEQGSIG